MLTKNTNTKRLIGLCSAAVVCAVGVGLADAHRGIQAAATNSSTSKTAQHATQSTTATPVTKSTSKKVAVKQKYKDGTYTGVGETRIGAVRVAVTLKRDKITNVSITGYSTHYPIRYINPILPQELLARQNINKIDVVSGATLSTADFYYAVVSCLNQAHHAELATSAKSNA